VHWFAESGKSLSPFTADLYIDAEIMSDQKSSPAQAERLATVDNYSSS
jgi:hypothetical protein